MKITAWLTSPDLRIVAHLYSGYAIELFEHLQNNDSWKTNGLVIGSPAFQLSTSSNPSPKMGGARILENQMELRPDQVQDLFEFLTAQESLLKRISLRDIEDAEQTISKVYQLIAAYGRKVREGRVTNSLRLQNRTSSPFSSRAATISPFIKLLRFVMPHQNRSEPGSAKANLRHSICQG